jgi:pyruvate/2-oxoglutarate dehydrogenase complex dihydrolipoamide dehydrogenase (E3) component/uncharacterized membrane protein YdjX (TVP38/TMEM64 family)
MQARKLLILGLIVLAFAVLAALGVGDDFSFDALRLQHSTLEQRVQAAPLRSAVIFFLVYVAMTAVSFPGATVMTVAAGALFGLGWGTLIVSFASSLGSVLAFLAARYLLRDLVAGRFSSVLARIDAGIEREGGYYLFGLRLVPLFPFFAINLAMGLTTMRVWPFYCISQVGMLAGTVLYVNAGTQLAGLDSLAGIASPAVLVSFAALGVFPWAAKRLLEAGRRRRVLRGYPKPPVFDANLIVIGAGSGGLVAAYLGAALKARTVLIERDRMGGDCLNTGCVPSKTMLHSARIAALMRRGSEFGLACVAPEVDFSSVMARVRKAIATIEPHDSVARYSSLGVECIAGQARLLSPYEVEVAGRRITAPNIILATGGKPRIPDLPGLAKAPFVTSDTVWSLDQIPQRLLVLGGGPIGCELAQAFARLGSKVALVTRNSRLLPREDPDASALITEQFHGEGIKLFLSHQPLRIEDAADGWSLVCLHDRSEERVPFDRLLLAVGRQARTDGLGLENLPIGRGADGSIIVDEYLRTDLPNVYAVGDVIGHYHHTHTASHQAYFAVTNALFAPLKRSRVDYSAVPWVIFTDPEVAHLGLNEREASERQIRYEVTRYDLSDSDRAIAAGATLGFVKVLTEPGRDRILGATIVGEQAGELIAEFGLAMRHGLGLSKVLATIHVYPTLSEANKAVAGIWRRTHTSPRLLEWLARFHRWRLVGR